MQLFSATVLIFAPIGAFGYALARLWGHGITWLDLGVGAGMYFFTGFGVTLGFHRHLAHRSFKLNRVLRIIVLIAGSMSIQGSVLTWVGQHRKHHAFTERGGDPHSPYRYGPGRWQMVKGFVYAHAGWFFRPNPVDAERWTPDLLADRDVVRISSTALLWGVLSLAIPFFVGLGVTGTWSGAVGVLLWGGVVRLGLLHHVTFSTNSVCHMFGRQPFETGDASTNFAPLAVLSFGESWHNGHHAFPASARHGLDRGQVDSTAGLIRLLERLGWAWSVRWPDPERVEGRRKATGSRTRGDAARALAGPGASPPA